MIGWTAVLFALQGWLSETAAQKAATSTPAIFSVGMALLSLAVGYMPLFLPPQAPKAAPVGGSGTGAPPAMPPS
jgi:hypothetical protein